MDFKVQRDWGKGKRSVTIAIVDTELSRVPAKLCQALLDAERGENPAAILQAYAALLDPMLGALQLSLLGDDGGDGDGADA
jgi:hypothetical protein